MGIEVIQNLLDPLLDGLGPFVKALDARLVDIHAGPTTEMLIEKGTDRFSIWLTSKETDTGSFATTKRFKIGYRIIEGDESMAVKAVEMLKTKIERNEQNLDAFVYETVFHSGNNADSGKQDPDLVLFHDMAELRITLKCNEKCPFCNTIVDPHTSPDNVVDDPARITALIEDAKSKGAKTVVFTGGEPTLLKDLPKWISLVKSMGMQAWIQTNGVIPWNPTYCKRFPDLPDYVFMSFHTTKPERVGQITGVAGTLSKKVSAIKALRDAGISLGINFVITTLNMDEIPISQDFCTPF